MSGVKRDKTIKDVREADEAASVQEERENPLESVTVQELYLVIGEQQANLYRLQRNETHLVNKLNEQEAELKMLRAGKKEKK